MEKYHVSSLIQYFVFSSWKMGCIRCISKQVYNKKNYDIYQEHSVLLTLFILVEYSIHIQFE